MFLSGIFLAKQNPIVRSPEFIEKNPAAPIRHDCPFPAAIQVAQREQQIIPDALNIIDMTEICGFRIPVPGQ